MNVILMGYRGCGKTTLGKMLADELWYTFADVDREICKRFGDDSIAHIWQEHGEPKYRQVEVEVTADLCGREKHVIALGGGTLMQPGAREAVERAPDTRKIYLECQPQVLLQRIAADGQSAATRPALTDRGDGLEEIESVLAQRDPVYRAVADKVFDVTHLGPREALRYLIKNCL